MVQNTGGIDALLQEERIFPPPADFVAKANLSDPDIYAKAAADPEGFWAGLAEELDWFQKWDTVLDWSDAPFAKWFIGGKLNVSYNCIDRHVKNGRRNKAAIVWEGEPGDWKVYTYGDLLREVCQFANGLKSLGVQKGRPATAKWIFDLKEDDVYWCTADIGWVTGHSYIVYGPLANGATTVMYEGSPDYPDRDRFWAVVAKYGVSILYTAPTAIRTFMRWGESYPQKHDMSTLRLMGTVGEPINPEAWVWYWQHIGGGRCPVVDTWWQTETGSIMIAPIPGLTTLKPGSATKAFPGIEAEILDGDGNPVGPGSGGYLVVKRPWPSMLRTVYGDPDRFIDTYWSRYDGIYFTADGARMDEDGYFWLLGRVDDVINVSGHRIGTMEVESALVDNHKVAEAACIGKDHAVKGQAVVAFVTLKDGVDMSDDVITELKAHVAGKIGAMARPDDIHFAAELPKTRSGKIMRRLLRDVAEGRALGDTTTLADPTVVDSLKTQYGDEE
ncbi:Acetyl-coenzyme A synthetase [Geodia barretti]|uniref:acetate--CoA ligase n=1 Tax=Geodia barretti TaxID=519541 RepID=A0AA35WAS5_GEOBA|nr:Acetyl-coenzyme A synthetase [Geodia barretti]